MRLLACRLTIPQKLIATIFTICRRERGLKSVTPGARRASLAKLIYSGMTEAIRSQRLPPIAPIPQQTMWLGRRRRETCMALPSISRYQLFFSNIAAVALLFSAATAVRDQVVTPASVPTGRQPLGLAVASGTDGQGYAVVANSGDSSISIFHLNLTSQTLSLDRATTITGIPSPYGVSACGTGTALVTSPTDNSVRLIQVPSGQVLASFS